jgi:hypothetical protein
MNAIVWTILIGAGAFLALGGGLNYVIKMFS